MSKGRSIKLCIFILAIALSVCCVGSALAVYSVDATVAISLAPKISDRYYVKLFSGGTERSSVELTKNSGDQYTANVKVKTTDTIKYYKNNTEITDYTFHGDSLFTTSAPAEFYYDFCYIVNGSGADQVRIYQCYYLVGSMSGWSADNPNAIKLSTDSTITDGNTAVIKNVSFNAGDEFKILTYNNKWYDCKGGASLDFTIYIGGGGNAVVCVDGSYNVYLNAGDDGFYVGPIDNAPWDGRLSIDVQNVSFFNDGNALCYVYVYYKNNTENASFPGVRATSMGENKFSVATDLARTISFVIVSRVNPNNTSQAWNQTANLTNIPANHKIELASNAM